MKKWAIIGLICLLAGAGRAQQDPLFTQYMFNQLIYNPAYAGSRDQLSMVAIGRQQWTGWEGAPRTQSFGIHTPTADQRHGFGLHVLNDRTGFTSNTQTSFSYAYRIPLGRSDSLFLALGLAAGMNSYWVRLSEVETWQQGDVAFGNGGDFQRWMFQSGPGMYLDGRNFFVGLSVPNIIPNRLYDPFYEQLIAEKSRTLYAAAGYRYEVSPALTVRASTLWKKTPGAPWATDLSLGLLLKQRLLVGASYRPDNAWAGYAVIYPTRLLRIGYAYDYATTPLRDYTTGSHELMIGFDFGFQKVKMVSPKLF